jgi:hypothetical protein
VEPPFEKFLGNRSIPTLESLLEVSKNKLYWPNTPQEWGSSCNRQQTHWYIGMSTRDRKSNPESNRNLFALALWFFFFNQLKMYIYTFLSLSLYLGWL